jgi:hypothetical protein
LGISRGSCRSTCGDDAQLGEPERGRMSTLQGLALGLFGSSTWVAGVAPSKSLIHTRRHPSPSSRQSRSTHVKTVSFLLPDRVRPLRVDRAASQTTSRGWISPPALVHLVCFGHAAPSMGWISRARRRGFHLTGFSVNNVDESGFAASGAAVFDVVVVAHGVNGFLWTGICWF